MIWKPAEEMAAPQAHQLVNLRTPSYWYSQNTDLELGLQPAIPGPQKSAVAVQPGAAIALQTLRSVGHVNAQYIWFAHGFAYAGVEDNMVTAKTPFAITARRRRISP